MGKNKILIIFLILLSVPIYSKENIFLLGEYEESNIMRTPLPLWATPSPIISFTATEISNYDFETLSDLLNDNGNFYIEKLPFRGVLYSSGIKNGYLFMIDGIPFPSPTSLILNPVDFQLPLTIFRKVIIIPGPFTSIWGFNAWGGVINLETRNGILKNRFKMTFSTVGYGKGEILKGYNSHNLQVITYLSYLYGKTINRFPYYYPVLIHPAGPLTSAGTVLKKNYLHISDTPDWYFTFFNKILTPSLSGEILLTDFKNYYTISSFSGMPLKKPGYRSTPSFLVHLHKHINIKNTKFKLSFFFSRDWINNLIPLYRITKITPSQAAVRNKSNSLNWGAEGTALLNINKSITLNIGLLESFSAMESHIYDEDPFTAGEYNILSVRKDSWLHSLFLQLSYLSSNTGFIGGLRIHKQNPFPLIASPFLSMSIKWKNFLLRGLYGVSFRTPESINYTLLGIGLIKQQVNQILFKETNPEELNTASFTISHSWNYFTITTGISWNKIVSEISNYIEDGKFIITNTPGNRWLSYYGEGKFNLHPFLVDIRIDYNTRKQNNIPPFIGKTKVIYSNSRWQAHIAAITYGSSNLDNFTTTINTNISYSITNNIKQSITIKNLTNTKLKYSSQNFSIPGTTRELRYSIEYKW